MTRLIGKSLEWIPLPGLQRDHVIDELTKDAVAIEDCGDHVWVASINNLGTILYCYGLAAFETETNGRRFNAWHLKRIPEADGPDVYDCPPDILDMCRVMNQGWRDRCREKR